MENPEEVLQLLERFTKLKQKDIPRELEEYLSFVARTGDTVYRWALVKNLFREKLVNVITDFHDNTPSIADLPPCPNVDPFNYERMKRTLLERLDAFNSAPFTVQRICELLTEPRKQYTRIDKFMRAVEKNILVVSTQEPGRRRNDSENGDSLDSIVNGDLEVNVDIEMDNEAFGMDPHELIPSITTEDSVTLPIVPEQAVLREEDAPVKEATIGDVDNGVAGEPKESEDTVEQECAEIREKLPPSEDVITEEKDAAKDIFEKADESETDSGIIEEPDNSFEIDKPEKKESVDFPEDKVTVEKAPSEQECLFELALENNQEKYSKEAFQQDEAKNDQDETVDEINEREKPPSADGNDEDSPSPKIAKYDSEPISHDEPKEHAVIEANSEALLKDDTVDNPAQKVEESDAQIEVLQPTETQKPDVVEEEEAQDAKIAAQVSNESEILATCDVEQLQEPNPEADGVKVADPIESSSPLVADTAAAVNEIQPESAHVEPSVADAIAEGSKEGAIAVTEGSSPNEITEVASDEMETVLASSVPENVMATDDEELVPAAIVVPLASDASAASKSDDNVMDVDESSVEPMDQ